VLHFIIKRLGQTVLVLFFVSIFSFMLIRMAPGNPAVMMLPDGASDEAVQEMEVKLGLDKPLYVQYAKYMSDVLKGNFGMSTAYKTEVRGIILQRLPNTGKLAFASVVVGCLIAIPLGIIAGSRKGTATDFFTMLFALLGQSMSPVWLSVLNVFVFGVWLRWLPTMGTGTAAHYVLPVITLAYPMAAQIARIGRSGMIDTLQEDYITATYAKGISRRVVNWKYAFKNAMVPIVTLVGMQMGAFLAGTIIVETVFSWSGIGQLLNLSVGNRDYALVQSLLLISATFFAVINLVVDIINSLIDPRITYK
jgi:ABC-type dipeptide/oligopeptide/nickel transport systems, permease components